MTDYLIQDKTNVVFVSTPELKARGDMRPYRMGEKKAEAGAKEPEKKETNPAAPNFENQGTNAERPPSYQPEPNPANEKPVMDARAEMEAIEDPDEMIAFIHEKYGLKLTKTMKKSTMIERALQTIEDRS